ncbi:kinase-like protein [Corynespora cassiicola Philippines]|uniref:EKC/KEOPS complex subunit BUD32 n=1 Tax=Corynespora cassiicola Philippines TaxID=1448308 RepID=A0A2T2NL98_CORCC|nr:kinase-like protein [Corynespora cassiicola Philippines]
MAPATDASTIEPIAPLEPPETPETSRPLHTLPAPFTDSNLEVLAQGAEALVYKTTFLTPSTPCVVKYRPPKPYRHPTLDKRLTKARLLAEARVLVRCKKDGVGVPGVIAGDWDMGWLVLEWIEGRTVRRILDEWAEGVVQREKEGKGHEGTADEGILDLMRRVGKAVGRLHSIGVCHGDLTTSNLMVRSAEKVQEQQSVPAGRQKASAMREAAITAEDEPKAPSLEGDIVLIDFGLATSADRNPHEDRAVDLYVLERAFAATHPAAEPLFQEVLRSYNDSYKDAKLVLRRLEDVRLRGRKRSMLG